MTLALHPVPDTDPRPDLAETGIGFRNEPVFYHGPDREPVPDGRTVVVVPGRVWPAAKPEYCTHTGLFELLPGDLLLVCPGCGLDGS